MSALFDTGVLLDYLRGVKPADAAVERFQHRAITVTTWVEILDAAPERLTKRTRDFLRTFERLAINEGIADRALTLMQRHQRLQIRHAIAWATAQANGLVYVTTELPKLSVGDDGVYVPYRVRTPRGRGRF